MIYLHIKFDCTENSFQMYHGNWYINYFPTLSLFVLFNMVKLEFCAFRLPSNSLSGYQWYRIRILKSLGLCQDSKKKESLVITNASILFTLRKVETRRNWNPKEINEMVNKESPWREASSHWDLQHIFIWHWVVHIPNCYF